VSWARVKQIEQFMLDNLFALAVHLLADRRNSSIPSIRVRRETGLAMKELIAALGKYASYPQLRAYELTAGDQMTSFGPFSEVIRKELER
jgi:hypothetical protein